MKKAVCVFVSALLCFCLASCKSQDNGLSSSSIVSENVKVKNEEINLLYFSGDSFNPYTAKTKYNREISRLIYDRLIKCDNDFNPVYCLAKSAELDGNRCMVSLNSANFTDGSPVTAADVIYSYNIAKKSDTPFAASLYEVVSAVEVSGAVEFTLDRTDPYFLNLLDFPIIKKNSDGIKNSDGVEQPPIGSGRYYVLDGALLRNESYFGKKGAVSKINLINAPDEISASHYVEVGAADIYYADELIENIARMSGKRADVNTNSFVYIGINSAYEPVSNSFLRYAISAAINRTEICHNAYFDNAVPATGYFNPKIRETAAVQSLKNISDTQITVENLDKIGYNRLVNGYYVNNSGNRLRLSLLVNSDNSSRVLAARLISEECRAAGIEITVSERPYNEYLSLLSSGGFQLYLGEIKVPANHDMSSLVLPGGSAAYGVTAKSGEDNLPASKTVCEEMIGRYRQGQCGIADLAGAFLTEMPQIPVCYRNGILFYTSRIKNTAEPTVSDIFFGFENYKF